MSQICRTSYLSNQDNQSQSYILILVIIPSFSNSSKKCSEFVNMLDFHRIQYYCREKLYHTMRVVAETGLKKEPDNPAMKLQFCISLILEDQIGEALRELESLLPKQDVTLAVIVAMLYAQNLCEVSTFSFDGVF